MAADPSARTKPSRSRSKGRETPDFDKGVMLPRPERVTGIIAASAPPASITSQRPDATRRAPLPMACAPAAHAVATVSQGPRHPLRIDTMAEPALAIIMGTRKGE